MTFNINRESIEAMEPWFVEKTVSAVKIPTISSDPKASQFVIEGAVYFHALLKEIGASSEIVQTRNHPLVLGTMNNGGTNDPTVMLYSHIDVQPAFASDWSRYPFSAEVDMNRKIIYGRGATDDKGPTMIGLAACKKARELGLPVNIRILLDTGEESGSIDIPHVIESHPDFFKGVDYLVLNDGMWVSKNTPSLILGRRGLVYMQLELSYRDGSVHSGLAGGVALNPLGRLDEVYAQCINTSTGKIKIPDIYKGNIPVPEDEAAACLENFDIDAYLSALGVHDSDMRIMSRREKLQAICASPTFELHGTAGGYTDWHGRSTSIPGKARKYVSMRVAPGQDPEEMLVAVKKYLHEVEPLVKISVLSSTPAYLIDGNETGLGYLEDAYEKGFGRRPLRVRGGGTESAAVDLQKATGRPPLPFQLSSPDEGYHRENECFNYGERLTGGVLTFLHFLDNVANAGK